MYLKQKYIVTDQNVMIVFSELMTHDEFRMFHPKSAGFISIGAENEDEYALPTVVCHGESISLRLKSAESDTALAVEQILGQGY